VDRRLEDHRQPFAGGFEVTLDPHP
jgi:hypothetical protein